MDTDIQQMKNSIIDVKNLMSQILNNMADDRREVRINNYYQ